MPAVDGESGKHCIHGAGHVKVVMRVQAMAGHGGPLAVAKRMGWGMKGRGKKPWGWWDDLENVRAEVRCY